MSSIRRILSVFTTNSSSVLFAFLLSVLLFSASFAGAQVEKGIITGLVTDATGAVIGNAQISLRNEATNVTTQTSSDAQGLYVSQPLVPGFYELRVDAKGFKNVAKRVRLEVSQRLSANVVLNIGEASETVEVDATAIQFDTDTSTVSSLRTEEAVHNLPLNGRNFAELLGLGAGVVPGQSQMAASVPYAQQRGPSSYVINGQRLTDNRFLLDGIGDNENHNGLGVIIFPPIDAIEEFREETTDADARYGRASGGVINVVFKSGTSKFHGEVFDFLRNSALDAANYFDTKKPGFRMNSFGATLGGPLFGGKEPRTFFFVDYAGERLSQGLTNIDTVPYWGPEGIGDFSHYDAAGTGQLIYDPEIYANSGGVTKSFFANDILPSKYWNATGKNVLALYSKLTPNRPGHTTSTTNNYLYTPQRIDNSNAWDIKVDHNFSDRDSGFVRFSQAHDYFYQPGILPTPLVGANICGPSTTPAYQSVLSETHVFSTALINTARFGWSRVFINAKNFNAGSGIASELGIPYNANETQAADGLAVFNFSSALTAIGDAGNSPTQIGTNNYQWNDNLNLNHGKHAFDVGVEVVRLQYNMYQSGSEHGSVSFGPYYTGHAISDALAGAPYSGSFAYVPGTRGFRQLDLSFYAQDSYKPTPKLTLNYGVRYDNFLGWPWTEVENRMYQFAPWLSTTQLYQVGTNGISASGVKGNNVNIAPRVGFSYRLLGKTTLHGGFGLYYAAPNVSNSAGLSNNAPGIDYWAFTNNRTTGYAAASFHPLSAGFVHTYDGTTTPKGSPVYAVDPDAKTPYSEQWHLSVQQQIGSVNRLTVAYVGNAGRHLDVLANINQATKDEDTSATARPYAYFGAINRLQTNLISSYNGLQTTWETRGKDLGVQVSYTYSHSLDENSSSPGNLVNAYNPRRDYGNSDQDLPNRLVGSVDYSLPFHAHGFAKPIVEGWKLNAIANFMDGIPFSVMATKSDLSSFDTATPYAHLASGNGNGSKPTGQRNIKEWFNTSAFSNPTPTTGSVWGNSRRNSLQGPGTKQFDLSVFKTIGLAEGKTLQLRSEFFNLTNTPQFNNPAVTAVGTPTTNGAGVITSAGAPTTLQRTSREVQLAAKILF